MRVPAVILALLGALLGAACVGDGPGPAGSAAGPVAGEAGARGSPPSAAAHPDTPLARMQAGTDSAAGVLIRLCRGDACETRGGDAARVLRLRDDGMVLFAVGRRPDTARVDLRGAAGGALVARQELEPSSLMAFAPTVSRGRYEVRLVATWAERRAVWRFALQVPPPDRRT